MPLLQSLSTDSSPPSSPDSAGFDLTEAMFGFTHSSSADEESDSESIQFVGVKFEAMRDEANLSDSDGSVDGSNGGNSTSSNSHLGEEDDYVQHNSVEPPQSPSTAATQNNNSPQSLGGDENSSVSEGGMEDEQSVVSIDSNSFEIMFSFSTDEEDSLNEASLEDTYDDLSSEEETNTSSGGSLPGKTALRFPPEKVLYDGLKFAGYNLSISRCGEVRNTSRFKAWYGVEPRTVSRFCEDLFEKYPSTKYRDVFMTLSWLKNYNTFHVMASTWGCEEYIGPTVEEYIKRFASLKEGKIRLDRFKDEPIIVFSIDNCHFSTEEFALSPSTKWYNFKQGSAGLKYEVAISIHHQEIMWIRGPLPCSVHDMTMFRGGTSKDIKKKKVDKEAFIFQIPDGKKGVGDSGCKCFSPPTRFIAIDC